MADGRACAPLEDFPLLAAHAAGGPPLAYLDNAATTQKPLCVLDAMDDFYRTACGNPHRSAHALAAAAAIYGRARRSRASSARRRRRRSRAATHLNTVALCYCAERLSRAADRAHAAGASQQPRAVADRGAAFRGRLSFIVPDRDGVVSDDEIDRAIGTRTRVVAFTGMSNVLGTVPPVKRIIEAAHACGAVAVLDCAQSIAHEPLDVHDLDVDFAAFSGHKLYGPMGIGVLYGKRRLLEETPPLLRGGGMVEAARPRSTERRGLKRARRMAGAAGWRKPRYLDRIGFDAVRAHERDPRPGERLDPSPPSGSTPRPNAGIRAAPSSRST
ncbi:MAG: aminotransferase class V-fold PLP-dependent enzyme [Eggerthella lenta]